MPNSLTPKRGRGRPPGSKSKPKPVLDWRDRLKLQPGEVLRKSGGTRSGNLDQRETETCDVVDLQGRTVGTVVYTEHFSIRPPFRSSHALLQTDSTGKVVFELRWCLDAWWATEALRGRRCWWGVGCAAQRPALHETFSRLKKGASHPSNEDDTTCRTTQMQIGQ